MKRGHNLRGHTGITAAKKCAVCGASYSAGPNAKYCGLKCRLMAFREVRGECWEWTGAKCPDGYGQIGIYIDRKRKSRIAHRISYEVFKGAVPTGKVVCHACDNPSCINPDHLWVGTVADNNRDKAIKGRARGRPRRSAELGV